MPDPETSNLLTPLVCRTLLSLMEVPELPDATVRDRIEAARLIHEMLLVWRWALQDPPSDPCTCLLPRPPEG